MVIIRYNFRKKCDFTHVLGKTQFVFRLTINCFPIKQKSVEIYNDFDASLY